ncbi:DUF3274 domain-containing protein [Pseudomonas syringae pv. tagetis]
MSDWKMDKKKLQLIERLPGWTKLSVEPQTLVEASHTYYQRGIFP